MRISNDFIMNFTLKEAAEELECSVAHVMKLCESGELTSHDLSIPGSKKRMIRIDKCEISRFKTKKRVQKTTNLAVQISSNKKARHRDFSTKIWIG